MHRLFYCLCFVPVRGLKTPNGLAIWCFGVTGYLVNTFIGKDVVEDKSVKAGGFSEALEAELNLVLEIGAVVLTSGFSAGLGTSDLLGGACREFELKLLK